MFAFSLVVLLLLLLGLRERAKIVHSSTVDVLKVAVDVHVRQLIFGGVALHRPLKLLYDAVGDASEPGALQHEASPYEDVRHHALS